MLEGRDLAAIRGERLVFERVGFALASTEALLLVGPNGSGKSTLLRLLAGLVRPAAGTLLWDGEDALADLSAHAGRVAYVGHLDAVKPGLTVIENIQFDVSRGAALTALDMYGLKALADVPARMLSAGQKRRLALSRLELSWAPIWLLDEPTLGLDAASIALFGERLEAHRAAQGCVVAATHVPLPLPDARELSLA